jgi:hypothetical protein
MQNLRLCRRPRCALRWWRRRRTWPPTLPPRVRPFSHRRCVGCAGQQLLMRPASRLRRPGRPGGWPDSRQCARTGAAGAGADPDWRRGHCRCPAGGPACNAARALPPADAHRARAVGRGWGAGPRQGEWNALWVRRPWLSRTVCRRPCTAASYNTVSSMRVRAPWVCCRRAGSSCPWPVTLLCGCVTVVPDWRIWEEGGGEGTAPRALARRCWRAPSPPRLKARFFHSLFPTCSRASCVSVRAIAPPAAFVGVR